MTNEEMDQMNAFNRFIMQNSFAREIMRKKNEEIATLQESIRACEDELTYYHERDKRDADMQLMIDQMKIFRM